MNNNKNLLFPKFLLLICIVSLLYPFSKARARTIQELQADEHYFIQSLNADPLNPDLLFNLATVYAHMGKELKAIGLYNQVISLNASDSIAMLRMAIILRNIGRIKDASLQLENCVKVDPHNSEAWFELAFTHTGLSMFRLALQDLDHSLENLVGNENAQKSLIIYFKGILYLTLKEFKKTHEMLLLLKSIDSEKYKQLKNILHSTGY